MEIGQRMKEYEKLETNRRLIPMLPIYIRLDGRYFSQLTKDMDKPYDQRMCNIMINVTKSLVRETNALIGYTQSDEINLVLPGYVDNKSCAFGNKIHKLTSIYAGMASSLFLINYMCFFHIVAGELKIAPSFDCRVINLPNETEVANMILWRNLDATKNAINSAASILFTNKELLNKTGNEKQEMLFKMGINFNDYPEHFKRGIFIRKIPVRELIDSKTWNKIPDKSKPKSRMILRKKIITLSMPPFSQVFNREEVIFKNAHPIPYPKGKLCQK